MLAVGYLFMPAGGTYSSITKQQQLIAAYGDEICLQVKDFFIEEQGSMTQYFMERKEGKKLFTLLQPGDILLVTKSEFVLSSVEDSLRLIAEMKKRRLFLHCLDLGGDIVHSPEEAEDGLASYNPTLYGQACDIPKQYKQHYSEEISPFGWQRTQDGSFYLHPGQQKKLEKKFK